MISTIMQRLTFTTFIVSEKIALLKILPRWMMTQPASWPDTDYYLDARFSCQSKILSHTEEFSGGEKN